MPAYQVTGPDGHKYRVDAPEGATADDAIAYIYDTHYGAKAAASPQDQSILRQVADVPLQAGTGVATGIRMLTDAFGADNQVSQGIRGVEDYLQSLLSAQAKDDQQEIGRIMQEAQDKGVADQVVAGLKAFTVAPVDFISQAAGTALPALAGGLAGAVLKAPALVGMLGTGAVMGAGTIKSSIYDATKQTLTEAGVDEVKAEAAAVQAQEYGGENLDQILIGTVLGAAAGATGVESSLIKPLTNRILGRAAAIEAGEQVATKAAEKGFVQGAIQEAIPEAAQAAQEQLAQNLALQRQGYDVPTMRGVVGAGTLEGIAGGVLGGGIEAYLGRGAEAETEPTVDTTAAPTPSAPSTEAAPTEPAAAPAVSSAVADLLDTEEVAAPPAEEKQKFEKIVKAKRKEGAEAPVTTVETPAPAEDLVELAKAKIAKSGKTVPNYIQNSLNAHFREAGIDRSVSLTEAKNIRDTLAGEGFLTKDPKTDKFVVSKPTITTEEAKAEAPRVPAPTVTEAAPKVESGRRGKRNVAPISAGLDAATEEGATVSDANRVGAAATTSTGTTTGKVGDESTLEKPSEVLAAEELLKAVDKGGMILNPAKVNSIARNLGLDVSTKAKPVDTVNRIRQAVERAKPTTVETKTETATSEAPSERYQSVMQRLNGLINTNRISRDLSQKLQNTLREQADPKKNPNYNEILSQADTIISKIEEQAEDFERGKLDIMNRRLSANEKLDLQNALLRQQEQVALGRAQKEMAAAEAVNALRDNSRKITEQEEELPSHVLKIRDAAKDGQVKSLTQMLVDSRSAVFQNPTNKEIKYRPIFTAVARALNKTDFSKVKTQTEDSIDADFKVYARLKKEGKLAEFDPATNTMYFRREGLYPGVVMHEFVHAGTIKNIRQYELDPSKLTADQRDGVERLLSVIDQLKAQTSDTTLVTEYENAFTSPYEFVAVAMSSPTFQARLANIEVTAPVGRKNLWTEFVRAIAKAFGIDAGNLDSPTALSEAGQAFSQILSAPSSEGVTGLAPFAAKAEKEPKEIDAFKEMAAEEEKLKAGRFNAVSASKYWFNNRNLGYERLVEKYQDRARYMTNLERTLDRAGVAIWAAPEDGGNVLSTANDLAAGEYKNNENVVTPLAMNLDKGVEAYVAKTGMDYEAAKTRLDTYFVAESINERRVTIHIFEKPLDTKPRVRLKGENKLISYAELRQRLIDSVLSENKLDDATRNAIYEKLLDLTIRDTEHKYADPLGASYRQTEKTGEVRKPGKRPLDFKDPYYDYITGWDYKTTQKVLDELKADKNQAEIAAVRKGLVDLDKVTMQFNEEAGFLTQPTKNLIKLYGWDKYVSLAGKTTKLADKYEKTMTMNTVPNEAPTAFRGRETAPHSPIYMAKVNAGKAATRAAKKNIVPTLVNLMKPNPISGKTYVKGSMVGTISFVDRFKGEVDLAESKFVGNNKFYNFLPNGDIEVWQVDDEKIVDALRPEFEKYNLGQSTLRFITSVMGQGHTRYQPKFAPFDFFRNASANTGLIANEFGLKSGAAYAGRVAKSVFMDFRIPQMWNIAAVYNQGNLKAIQKLGGYNPTTNTWADPYVRDAYDFIERGGKVSIVRSWQTKTRLEEFYDEARKSTARKKLEATKKFLDQYFDTWMDMFDMTARVEAYRTAKSIAMVKRKMNEEQASIYAASYAKNTANFEKKGTSKMSNYYMFWNPSATGAVRNIDSLVPMLRDVNTVVDELPDEIKNDPTAKAKFIESYNEQKKNAASSVLLYAGKGMFLYFVLRSIGGMLAGGDGEEPPENEVASDNKELWTRNMRLPLNWLGMESVKDKFFNIPWGFGMGAFAALGSQVAAWGTGDQTGKEFAGNMVSIGLDNYVPLPIARYNPFDHPIAWTLDSLAPSPLRGFVEYGLNVSGVGGPIYRDYYNKYGPTMVSNANTPESYKNLANFIAESTNNRYIPEPNEVKFFVTMYLDGIANMGSAAYDMVGNRIRQDRDFDPKQDLPFMGSFISNKINTAARDYYDVSEKLKAFQRGYDAAINSPDEKDRARFLAEFPNSPAIVAIFKSQDQGLKKLQEPINVIGVFAKTPKERKAQLEDIEKGKKAYMAMSTQLYESNPDFKKEIDSFSSKLPIFKRGP